MHDRLAAEGDLAPPQDVAVSQGMGVRVRHRDIGTPACGQAIRKVLEEPSYRAAAARLSRMLRARRQTPVQEAAGACGLLTDAHCQGLPSHLSALCIPEASVFSSLTCIPYFCLM